VRPLFDHAPARIPASSLCRKGAARGLATILPDALRFETERFIVNGDEHGVSTQTDQKNHSFMGLD
jgi:hypothetical protein